MGRNVPNEVVNGAELPDNEGEIEPDMGKTKRLELPKVLTCDDIDKFLLVLEDLEGVIAGRIKLFAELATGVALRHFPLMRDIEIAERITKHICTMILATF